MLVSKIRSLAIITLSKEGLKLAKRIREGLLMDYPAIDCFIYSPDEISEEGVNPVRDKPQLEVGYLIGKVSNGVNPFSQCLLDLTKEIFFKHQGLIFIMPLGIVIRAVAPNIESKFRDPAVVVIDEVGRYVISVLSGHEGGANGLALEVSNILHTEAVITTAKEAKRNLIVGLGFRKGIGEEKIKECILQTLSKVGASIEKVRLIATVDRKAKEEGLQKVCRAFGIPLKVIPYEEIKTCPREFHRSELVKKRIGLYGVSEPSALLAGRKTTLLIKEKYPEVVVAIARENFSW